MADGRRLFQLDEDTMRAGRVDERHERVFRTRPRLLVDDPCTARLELRERGEDVVNAKRDVMEPRATLLGVLRDRRVRRGCFEQFEFGFAHWQKVRSHAL